MYVTYSRILQDKLSSSKVFSKHKPVVVAAGDPGKGLAHGVAHRVLPLLDRQVEVDEDEGAVGEELVLEELVGDEPHGEDDDEVELLAHEEPDGVRVVLVVQVLLREDERGI